MRENFEAAWRNYRAKSPTWRKSLPTMWIARRSRRMHLGIRSHFQTPSLRKSARGDRAARAPQCANQIRRPFFDTVEAYGVPLEELRRAIDWAIWPISFRNGLLSDRVDIARHALALDDERTTFHPLRFDMSREETDRIKEVWFAGGHCDVGGGYPESSLAHVPLVWMAEEAENATTVVSGQRISTGLRFSAGALDDFRAKASAFGPMHNSRSVLSVLYRYDPRPIVEDASTRGPPVEFIIRPRRRWCSEARITRR